MKTKLLLIAWLCLFAMQALATSISFENHAVAINSSCCQEAEENIQFTVNAPAVASVLPHELSIPVSVTYTPSGGGEESSITASNGEIMTLPADVTSAELTATEIVYKDYTITVDASARTITVVYAETTDLEKAKAFANQLLTSKMVGYPASTTTAYTELNTAYSTADITLDALKEKISAFLSTTETSIVLPEIGKAYTFTFRTPTNRKFFMKYAESGYTIEETSAVNNTDYPDEAILVCVAKTNDGKYTFKNLPRKYFMWKGSNNGYNNNKGYSDEYNATYSWVKFTKMVSGASKVDRSNAQSDLFGSVAVQGKRNGTGTYDYSYFILTYSTTSASFNQENSYYYNKSGATQHTSALYIEPCEKYDVYSMNVTGNTSLPIGEMPERTVTREATSESDTHKYGFFICQQGEVPEASEFSASDIKYKDVTSITVDGTNKVVNVAYALTTDLEELRALANRLLSTERVGYPAINSTLRTRLSAAVAGSDVAALQAAINNYISTNEEDIILPKDGQAYTMTAATTDGKKFYMKYTDDGYTMVETTESDNTNYPEEAILICRDLGNGKYAFQNTAGKYMCWKGKDTNSGAHNSNKGFSNSYSADHTWIEVKKIVKGNKVGGSQSDLFGAVAVSGYRNYDKDNYISYYVINKTSGAYDQASVPFYDATYTSAILIEPVATVTYNPQPPMNNSEGAISEEIKKVATYSAPIATVVPRNVTAYYVSACEGAGGQATLVAWPNTGGQQVLPANTGVILTSTDADATLAALTPATSETENVLPSGSTNLLHNTAARPHTFAADEGFILAKGTYGVGLYKAKAGSTLARNKAYLTYSNPTHSVSTAVRMVIGGNTPTDITHLMPQEDVDEQAPIYDLSGRRVQHTVKGGLYIRNGRKFIVR